jgi:hypothetical protein
MKAIFSLFFFVDATLSWINPTNGYASLTHYTLGENTVAACGCTGGSTHYPTAALSQYAYGSSRAFGERLRAMPRRAALNTRVFQALAVESVLI